MTDAVDAYDWIVESPIGMAGCLTVVAKSDLDQVATTFGCSDLADPHSTDVGFDGPSTHESRLLLGVVAGSTIVVEDNSYEGSRPEVLRPASKASSDGLAASVFWNVNGLVMFSAARRGKLICSVELVDCDPADVPRNLRRLVRLGTIDGINLVALGAAMVALYTGVTFGQDVLTYGQSRSFTPVPANLAFLGQQGTMLPHNEPELLAAIVASTPSTQRRLANWAARAAAIEAGIDSEPLVQAVVEQLDDDALALLPPGYDGRIAAWTRDELQWERTHSDYDDFGGNIGALESFFLRGKTRAGLALKAATHPDPFEAALQATDNAWWTFYCTRIERAGRFIDDARGHRRVYTAQDSRPKRAQIFSELALEGLGSELTDWTDLNQRLPSPLNPEQRAQLIARDQELQASGAFAELQSVPDNQKPR